MKVSAIFDIGKTNKKFFLFDRHYREVHKEYIRFEEIADEDGFPCDDLQAIVGWIKGKLEEAMANPDWDVEAVNFSTYGASFVHLDRKGKPLTPLYNYLKPLPDETRQSFYDHYGAPGKVALETASPTLGMLNSGLQLFWLKHSRSDIHRQIHWSLHFPQYLSYVFTGIPVAEYTSVGCHTALWNFAGEDYHDWVYHEELDKHLPPLISTDTQISMRHKGRPIKVGVGIHDSSSALLPYVIADTKPFLLVSTGTWSIALNPFSTDSLTEADLSNDCLHFMRINGRPTKAARLFLGKEYSVQLDNLLTHYGVEKGTEKDISFAADHYRELKLKGDHHFRFEHISVPREQPSENRWRSFSSFAEAYTQLMFELTELQVEACRRAIGSSPINKIYIDGGFANNELYVHMLAQSFPEAKIRTTQSPLGSALGAAVVMADRPIGKRFLKEHYGLKKIKPVVDNVNQD